MNFMGSLRILSRPRARRPLRRSLGVGGVECRVQGFEFIGFIGFLGFIGFWVLGLGLIGFRV